MDRKQEVMIALGAAIGANCIPCFDHLYAKAKELKLDDNDISTAIETAYKVKNGATLFLKNAVSEVSGMESTVEGPCCEAASGSGCDGTC
jgi:hypothetical protein